MAAEREPKAPAPHSDDSLGVAPPVSPNLPEPPKRGVGRNAFETILFRGISTPVALAFVVLQSRLLEPEGRGEFVVVVLGATIVSRLLGQLGVAVTSRRLHSPHSVRELTHRALALGAVLGVVGAPAMVGVSGASGQVGWTLAAIGACGILPNVVWQTISGILLGEGRIRLWNVIQLLPPVLSLGALIVLVVVFDQGVGGALAGWSLAQAATAVFALWVTRDVWLPPSVPSPIDPDSRIIARLALVMGAVQVVNLVSYRAEVFVLGQDSGNVGVGIYSIAFQSVESMWLVPAAIATAVTAPAVAARTDGAAAALVGRASLRAFALAFVVAGAVGAAAPWVVPAVFGRDFDGAVTPLAILLPGVVAYAPVNVLVVYLSIRRGRPGLSLAVAVAAGIVTLATSLVLIPPYGASGAAGASSIGYGAGAVLTWFFFFRLQRTPAPASRTTLESG